MKFASRIRGSLAIITDGFHRASRLRFFAEAEFLVIFGLFEKIAVSAVVITREVRRCGLTAEVAVDALVVHVEGASHVFGIFVCEVSHR